MRQADGTGGRAASRRRAWGCLGAAALALLLAGCGAAQKRGIDLDSVPGARPKHEPKARYGNMQSYVVFGKTYYPQSTSRHHSERGVASWYGPKFHGKKTSSGERYDMHQMTAAHKTLPLPTYALVTNLENGRNLIVKINDRGPFVGDRIIDLSYAAAKSLGMDKQGTAMVQVTSIDPRDHDGEVPKTLRLADTALDRQRERSGRRAPAQAAATRARDSATPTVPARQPVAAARQPQVQPAAATAAAPRAQPAVASSGGGYYLQVGAFGTRANAEQMRRRLHDRLHAPVDIVDGHNLYRVRIGPLGSRGDAEQLAGELTPLGVGPAMVVSH
jgi:rare lipoprotein A